MGIPTPKAEEKVVYEGKILQVVTQDMDIDGKVVTFEWARRSPGTRIIVSKGRKILLNREYRREQGKWDYRLPGGKVFDKLIEYTAFLRDGGDVLSAALDAVKKEAREEVGLEVDTLTHFATSKNGATVEWNLYYFVADSYREIGSINHELGEVIDVEWVDISRVLELIKNGEFAEDRSVGVLMRYFMVNGYI
ncbi:MAG TPA: NUDIX domain-containing protein [Candidatus Dojkabacteria bacterium]|nr:NUDIX domain-containing protein [Candidatus Dojkabacteria bacterium]